MVNFMLMKTGAVYYALLLEFTAVNGGATVIYRGGSAFSRL
jgi:hypothetical protein